VQRLRALHPFRTDCGACFARYGNVRIARIPAWRY